MMQNGLVSRTSLRTRLWTFSWLRSHGWPVAGSLVVRSRLQPGVNVVPPKALPPASWQTRGCEKISQTSGPLRSKSSRAFFRISSTRMSSGTSRHLFNRLSGVSSITQSSRTLPVDKLHVRRE